MQDSYKFLVPTVASLTETQNKHCFSHKPQIYSKYSHNCSSTVNAENLNVT